MAKGRFVTKIVPKTTNNQTEAIINFLLSEGHSASRINTTGIWDKKIGAYRKTGGRVGFSDIIATLKTRFNHPNGRPFGVTLAIECKFTESDIISDEQKEFLAENSRAGGLSLIAHSVEEFHLMYNMIKENYL